MLFMFITVRTSDHKLGTVVVIVSNISCRVLSDLEGVSLVTVVLSHAHVRLHWI